MNELLYYLVLGVLLYYILTKFLHNFNLDQENFDPSLVPVSSIVTLAKVAQKLTTGGVLSSPQNLQIGTLNSGGAGNLTVTGKTTLNGTLTTTGAISANGEIYSGGSTGVISAGNTPSGNNFKFIAGGSTGNSVGGGVNDNSLNLYAYGPAAGTGGVNHVADFFGNGNVNIYGSITGNTTTATTNPFDYGQTIINGGEIKVGDNNNSIRIHRDNGTTGLIINGNNYGVLTTNEGTKMNMIQLQWNPTGVTIPKDLNVSGSIVTAGENFTINSPSVSINSPTTTINGNLNINGMINYPAAILPYPIDPCGYFKVRAYGKRVPLYYGWNMLWRDNTWSESLRTKQKWNGSTSEQFVNYVSFDNDLGSNSDTNWSARYLAVKPGFKITPYINDGPMVKKDTYTAGEYNFPDWKYPENQAGNSCGSSGCNYRVHLIAVQLATDTWSLPAQFNA